MSSNHGYWNHIVLALLATAVVCGCSSDGASQPASNLPPPPAPPATPAPSGSFHYVGAYADGWAGVGELEIDFRGCDGLVFWVDKVGICPDLLVDGLPVTMDVSDPGPIIESGAMIELHIEVTNWVGFGAWVDVQHAVTGPVEVVDPANARLTVLGQTVHFTDLAAGFGQRAQHGVANLRELNVGDHVAVSGHFSAAGEIIASLVERPPSPGPLLLRGVLAAGADGALRIGAMQIDLSGSNLDGFPGGTPLAGDTVLLFVGQSPQDGVLAVHTARYASRGPHDFALETLTGFVTAARDSHDFDVGGYRFLTYSCDTCEALDQLGKRPAVGTYVTVNKLFDVKAHVSLGWPTEIGVGLVGPVEIIDSEAGSLTVLGFTVQTSPATHISADDSPWLGSETLELTALAIGDTLTVSGGVLDDMIVAGRLQRAGEGNWIRTSHYELSDQIIGILDRAILIDDSTIILHCDRGEDTCRVADREWLFNHPGRPWLAVQVEDAETQLRATLVEAWTY